MNRTYSVGSSTVPTPTSLKPISPQIYVTEVPQHEIAGPSYGKTQSSTHKFVVDAHQLQYETTKKFIFLSNRMDELLHSMSPGALSDSLSTVEDDYPADNLSSNASRQQTMDSIVTESEPSDDYFGNMDGSPSMTPGGIRSIAGPKQRKQISALVDEFQNSVNDRHETLQRLNSWFQNVSQREFQEADEATDSLNEGELILQQTQNSWTEMLEHLRSGADRLKGIQHNLKDIFSFINVFMSVRENQEKSDLAQEHQTLKDHLTRLRQEFELLSQDYQQVTLKLQSVSKRCEVLQFLVDYKAKESGRLITHSDTEIVRLRSLLDYHKAENAKLRTEFANQLDACKRDAQEWFQYEKLYFLNPDARPHSREVSVRALQERMKNIEKRAVEVLGIDPATGLATKRGPEGVQSFHTQAFSELQREIEAKNNFIRDLLALIEAVRLDPSSEKLKAMEDIQINIQESMKAVRSSRDKDTQTEIVDISTRVLNKKRLEDTTKTLCDEVRSTETRTTQFTSQTLQDIIDAVIDHTEVLQHNLEADMLAMNGNRQAATKRLDSFKNEVTKAIEELLVSERESWLNEMEKSHKSLSLIRQDILSIIAQFVIPEDISVYLEPISETEQKQLASQLYSLAVQENETIRTQLEEAQQSSVVIQGEKRSLMRELQTVKKQQRSMASKLKQQISDRGSVELEQQSLQQTIDTMKEEWDKEKAETLAREEEYERKIAFLSKRGNEKNKTLEDTRAYEKQQLIKKAEQLRHQALDLEKQRLALKAQNESLTAKVSELVASSRNDADEVAILRKRLALNNTATTEADMAKHYSDIIADYESTIVQRSSDVRAANAEIAALKEKVLEYENAKLKWEMLAINSHSESQIQKPSASKSVQTDVNPEETDKRKKRVKKSESANEDGKKKKKKGKKRRPSEADAPTTTQTTSPQTDQPFESIAAPIETLEDEHIEQDDDDPVDTTPRTVSPSEHLTAPSTANAQSEHDDSEAESDVESSTREAPQTEGTRTPSHRSEALSRGDRLESPFLRSVTPQSIPTTPSRLSAPSPGGRGKSIFVTIPTVSRGSFESQSSSQRSDSKTDIDIVDELNSKVVQLKAENNALSEQMEYWMNKFNELKRSMTPHSEEQRFEMEATTLDNQNDQIRSTDENSDVNNYQERESRKSSAGAYFDNQKDVQENEQVLTLDSKELKYAVTQLNQKVDSCIRRLSERFSTDFNIVKKESNEQHSPPGEAQAVWERIHKLDKLLEALKAMNASGADQLLLRRSKSAIGDYEHRRALRGDYRLNTLTSGADMDEAERPTQTDEDDAMHRLRYESKQFFSRDKHIRQLRVKFTFSKLHEKQKLLALKAKAAKARMSNKVVDKKFLAHMQRMETYHSRRVESWEAKRQALIAERNKMIEKVLGTLHRLMDEEPSPAPLPQQPPAKEANVYLISYASRSGSNLQNRKNEQSPTQNDQRTSGAPSSMKQSAMMTLISDSDLVRERRQHSRTLFGNPNKESKSRAGYSRVLQEGLPNLSNNRRKSLSEYRSQSSTAVESASSNHSKSFYINRSTAPVRVPQRAKTSFAKYAASLPRHEALDAMKLPGGDNDIEQNEAYYS